MYDDSSEARNRATLAISSGLAIRRIGVVRTRASLLLAPKASTSIGVSTTPGWIELTRMPKRASSSAPAAVIPVTAYFVAA